MTTTISFSRQKSEKSSDAGLDWLFSQLHGLFGAKFTDAWRSGTTVDGRDTGLENMRVVWGEKIRENELKIAEVKAGIKRAEILKWPPTWSEFIDLCRPPINVDLAFDEAIRQLAARENDTDVWSDPAIYWAARAVGEFDMRHLSRDSLKPRFTAALKKVKEGPVLPVPPRSIALPEPSVISLARQDNLKKIEELSCVIKQLPKSRSGKNIGWAIKIIDEHERTGKGDLHRLRIAREAVHNAKGAESDD